MTRSLKTAAVLLLTAASPLLADMPKIVKVDVSKPDMGWRFEVTVRHSDTGWDHYADGWEIVDMDGNRLGYRKLHHPHVDEQPFTRSLRGVMIPDGVRKVIVRASCNKDGWVSEGMTVDLSPIGKAEY